MDQQIKSVNLDIENIPDKIPILPLVEVVLFPKMVVPLLVSQDELIKLVEEAMDRDRIVGLLVSKQENFERRKIDENLYTTGTVGYILKMFKNDNESVQLMVQGIERFRIKRYLKDTSFINAEIELLKDSISVDKETEALMSNIKELYERVIKNSTVLPAEIGSLARSVKEPGILADMVTSTINTTVEEKQGVLELTDVKGRLKEATKLINYQLEIIEMGSKIQTQVKEDIDKKQREYYLQQQLKKIREELGETEDLNIEIEEYREKIETRGLPENAKKEAHRELKRLSRMNPSSAEYTVSTTYLDWITSLPWQESSSDNIDIKNARTILDRDHYGLEKVKKRILEYLAVKKLKPDSKSPILCFAGPPGTGKTSLGKSIANSLGRTYIRMALGGLKDEAEIRGHRRTYIGALPGRIVQEIRRVGKNNPVVVFDEIDKVGASYQGDPSSALLEVLDPEQNNTFKDHYLDVEFDLSNVIFLTTANVVHTIPAPLRDRMEIIDISGYTLEEKVKIVKKYILPRQRTFHGLSPKNLTLSAGAIKHVISGYTREAGLRNLEREIASICRGAACKIAEEELESINVNIKDVSRYLGQVKVSPEMSSVITMPGVVMGLAWTPAGGDLLYIETTMMKGNGKLTLTGHLGEVMRESANTALSFIRSKADLLGINEELFRSYDIHVHVPSGAIPKDGPSAGVTIFTALVLLFLNRVVKEKVAMTGEITLRGRVLPVGGIKEKILAAYRSGIKTLILPKENKRDLEDIPDNILKHVNIHFAEKMMDVLKIAVG